MGRRSAAGLVIGTLACTALLAGDQRAAAHEQDLSPADRAAAVHTFAGRLERYASLRARIAEPLPSFDDARRDPWSLFLQRHYLASAIRTARREVRMGDIFTPPVAAMFRHDIGEAVYDIDIEGLVDEGVQAGLVDLTVNEPIPAWAMRPVPGVLLERLPRLPGAIEYRLVGDALILWDAHAGILIDALPGVLVVTVPLTARVEVTGRTVAVEEPAKVATKASRAA